MNLSRRHLFILIVGLTTWACSFCVFAVELDNTLNLAFVADRQEPLIDVIDVKKGKVVYTIETGFPVDNLVVSPYTPVLVYTSAQQPLAVFYDLADKKVARQVELDFSPRHLVLDTTGLKAAATDSEGGGFALLSLTSRSLMFQLESFPATTDVLFDPNDVDIYFTNPANASLGVLNINSRTVREFPLADHSPQALSAPSRSLDGRHIYVANQTAGEVYSINTFSKQTFRTFAIGSAPARPFTTPQGSFLYVMDEISGRMAIIDQGAFQEYADVQFEHGVNAAAVGRFDRFGVLLSTENRRFSIYDNAHKTTVLNAQFKAQPLEVFGSADGRTAFVAFADSAEIAMIDLESQAVRYFEATRNGAAAFTMGLSNNVCH